MRRSDREKEKIIVQGSAKPLSKLASGRVPKSIRDIVFLYLEEFARKEDDALNNRLLAELIDGYSNIERKVDSLLKNTLPEVVAEEIKLKGGYTPREHLCTILFSDLVGFTRIAERVSPITLIMALDQIFSSFDEITATLGGTKIKTIGDAYMAVFGAPQEMENHAYLAIEAGLKMISSLEEFNQKNKDFGKMAMRVGRHTGKVISGVVGKERMQFDVFGDNVNIASRLETSSEPGRITVSRGTYELVKDLFVFEERGFVPLKNKAPILAYFVKGRRHG